MEYNQREYEELYCTLFNNLIDCVFVVSVDGVLLDINCSGLEMLGYAKEEICGFPVSVFTHPDDHAKIMNAHQEMLNSKCYNNKLFARLIRKNGSLIYIESTRMLINRDGRPYALQVIARDITEKKYAEERLRILSRAVEQSPVSIIIVNNKGIIEYVNPKFTEVSGFTFEEIAGQDSRILAPGQNLHDGFQRLKEIVSSGREWKGEVQNRKKNGEEYWESVSISPITDDEGSITHFVAIKEETTDKKQIEQQLVESEERYRTIFENSPVGVAIIKDLHIHQANSTYAKMYGFRDCVEVQNMPIIDRITPEYKTFVMDKFKERVTDEKNSIAYDSISLRKDGSRFPVHVELTSMNLSGEKAVVALISDITELRDREEKIKSSLNEKEILLKEIHHRVKNNLQIISSLLSLQSEYINDKKAFELFIESMNRIRSMAIIHEKLYQTNNFSRIDASEYVTELVNYLFRTYQDSTRRIALESDIDNINIVIDTAIPCGLIINELISNSLKYAFPENRQGVITVAFKQNGTSGYELSIGDNGIGLPADFDFSKTNSLGLMLVTSLTEQLNGTFELERSCGTKVKIKFPAGKSS